MNKKSSLLSILTLLVFGVMAATVSRADPITITYTGDDVINIFAQCSGDACEGESSDLYSVGVNFNNWMSADTLSGDFDITNNYLVFMVSNVVTDQYPATGSNPAGFLAQIVFGGSTFLTGADWEVTTCDPYTDLESVTCDWSGWVAASEYGSNGDTTNVWSANVSGNMISGIDSSAQWIWSSLNGCTTAAGFSNPSDSCHVNTVDQVLAVRVLINEVPEPASIALLGLGLLGLGFGARRR